MFDKNLPQSATIAEEFQLKIKKEHSKAKLIQYMPVVLLVVFIIALLIIANFNLVNLKTIFSLLPTALIMALGITFVIMMGSIDLSLEGVVALSGAVFSLLVANQKNDIDLGFGGFLIGILVGTVCGLVTGLLHVKGKIPSFMVTFGMTNIASGLTLIVYGGSPANLTAAPEGSIGFAELGLLKFGPQDGFNIPATLIVAVIVFAIAYILQNKTGFGRYVYAIGKNEGVLRGTGINIDKTKIKVFMWSGFCFGVAGVLGAMMLGSGDLTVGDGKLFPAITAVVVGGTSLSGGTGGVMNTLVGVLIVVVLQTALILLGVESTLQTAIQGALIVIAVALSVTRGSKVVTK